MRTRPLGRSGIRVSPYGLGAMVVGGGNGSTWLEPVADEQYEQALTALDV